MTREDVIERLRERLDTGRLYRRLKGSIADVCDRYLPLSGLNDRNGLLNNHLPGWLTRSRIDYILRAYQDLLDQDQARDRAIEAIHDEVVQLIRLRGAQQLSCDLTAFLEELQLTAAQYAAMPESHPDEEDLRHKFEAACRITVREHIMHNNHLDVIAFRNSLSDTAQNMCESLLNRHFATFHSGVADSPLLTDLIRTLSLEADNDPVETYDVVTRM